MPQTMVVVRETAQTMMGVTSALVEMVMNSMKTNTAVMVPSSYFYSLFVQNVMECGTFNTINSSLKSFRLNGIGLQYICIILSFMIMICHSNSVNQTQQMQLPGFCLVRDF